MREVACTLILVCILRLTTQGIASTCNPDGTFFPPGFENGNFPDVLNLDNQIEAGYTGTGVPLRVAISGANEKPISIRFLPQWMLLTTGPVDSKCDDVMSQLTGATTARKLQASAYTVVKPAQYTFSWNLNSDPETSVGKFPGDSPAPKMTVPLSLRPDGEYCLFVHADVMKGTASVSTPSGTVALPLEDKRITKYFCFKKVTDRITASLSFDSCAKNFTVTVGNISQDPYLASPTLQLYSVVVYIFGNTSRVADPEKRQDFIDTYMDWYNPTQKPGKMSWSFGGLKEGVYDIRARTFIRSTVPSLMNVSGIQPAPSNSYSDGSSLYLGWVLNNDKPYKVTVFNQATSIGPVDCDFDASRITFSWLPTGTGTQACKVDGKNGNNIRDSVSGSLKGCEAPWQYDLADASNHTLEIFFYDSCGKTVRRELQFGTWGCAVNMTAEPPAPPSPPTPASPIPDSLITEAPYSGSGFSTGGLNTSGLTAFGSNTGKSGAAGLVLNKLAAISLVVCALLSAMWIGGA